MTLLFDLPERPSIPVTGKEARFPVNRIFCVGRNYAEHSREMGGDPTREAPFFFTKPADAVVESGAVIPFPPKTADLHHEAELVVALGRGGIDVSVADAPSLIWGHAAGNDLTRRDVQRAAKSNGLPWEGAKVFDGAAPMTAVVPVSRTGHPEGRRRLRPAGPRLPARSHCPVHRGQRRAGDHCAVHAA